MLDICLIQENNSICRKVTLIKDECRVKAGKEKVRVALRNRGYPEWALKEGDQLWKRQKRRKEEVGRHGDKDRQEENPKKAYIMLPYMNGVMERLQRAYKKHDIQLFCGCMPKGPPGPGRVIRYGYTSASVNSVDSCMWVRWRDL